MIYRASVWTRNRVGAPRFVCGGYGPTVRDAARRARVLAALSVKERTRVELTSTQFLDPRAPFREEDTRRCTITPLRLCSDGGFRHQFAVATFHCGRAKGVCRRCGVFSTLSRRGRRLRTLELFRFQEEPPEDSPWFWFREEDEEGHPTGWGQVCVLINQAETEIDLAGTPACARDIARAWGRCEDELEVLSSEEAGRAGDPGTLAVNNALYDIEKGAIRSLLSDSLRSMLSFDPSEIAAFVRRELERSLTERKTRVLVVS